VSSSSSHNGRERRGDRAAAVVAFLQEVLTNKSLTVADLEVRARAAGLLGEHQRITDAKHFKRAKAKLNIKSWRHGFGSRGAWFWSLPARPCSQSDDIAKAAASMMRTGEAAYDQDHSRPDAVHSRLTGMAGEIPLKPNIPLQWVQGAGRLQHLPAHAGVPAHRWRVFLNDVDHFLRHWAARAADLSWDAASVFACHPGRPMEYLQGAGLVWRLCGGKITDMHADWAMIEVNAERQVVHRRPAPANFVLPLRRAA
jgi:hypothetical protein